MKVTEYKVVEHSNLDKFQELMMNRLRCGWSLQGAPFFVAGRDVWCQAVTRLVEPSFVAGIREDEPLGDMISRLCDHARARPKCESPAA